MCLSESYAQFFCCTHVWLKLFLVYYILVLMQLSSMFLDWNIFLIVGVCVCVWLQGPNHFGLPKSLYMHLARSILTAKHPELVKGTRVHFFILFVGTHSRKKRQTKYSVAAVFLPVRCEVFLFFDDPDDPSIRHAKSLEDYAQSKKMAGAGLSVHRMDTSWWEKAKARSRFYQRQDAWMNTPLKN